MNNKELTELKKEFEQMFYTEVAPSLNPNAEPPYNASQKVDVFWNKKPSEVWDFLLPHLKSNDEIKREAVEEFLKSQIEYEAEEYAVCPLCKREFIWGETYCPDDRRKLITETRNKLEWSNRNAVIKELIEGLTQKENNE